MKVYALGRPVITSSFAQIFYFLEATSLLQPCSQIGPRRMRRGTDRGNKDGQRYTMVSSLEQLSCHPSSIRFGNTVRCAGHKSSHPSPTTVQYPTSLNPSLSTATTHPYPPVLSSVTHLRGFRGRKDPMRSV